ncbi:S-layer homology domain-containing protein [Candidatus Peregrinibacteria bacterium]|nr:MAG: S-layer homology domain-containing protein [Candidatus Peregrinibacteria bacterium]
MNRIMNLLNRFVASVAGLSVALSAVLVAVPTASAGTPHFTDISGHWAESYITDLAEQDIISTTNADGSSKTMFYPNNSLTRAELTKLALEAFYGDSVSDLADAFADPANPSFSDVPSDAWYFDYVEVAKGLDIVQGFADGTFGPNSPITRSAALKVILLTGEIETMLTPATPFTDVSSGDWFYEYVTTAYNHCIVNGTSSTMFTPNGNVTRAESAKIISNSIMVANGEDICNMTGDDDDTTTGDDDDTTTGDDDDTTSTVSDSVLEVSLSSENPKGTSIPQTGSNIPFLALDLTNTGDEAVEATGFVISHGGLGDENDVDNVKIFDDVEQRGSDRSFTKDGEIAPLNLSSEPIEIAAGSTKTIVVAGDMLANTAGGEHNFFIAGSSDIIAVGAETGGSVEVTGDFPIRGNDMRVANVSTGSLTFTFQSVADTTVEVGQSEVELARMKVEAGSAEDVLLQALTLQLDGIDDGDIGNLYVEFQGQRISDIVPFAKGEKATFKFTDNDDHGWIMKEGDNRTIRVKGDILAGVSSTVTASFDSIASDVVAKGLTYGFGVTLTDAGTSDSIAIQGGDITFSVNSSTRDVAPDTDAVEFGILTIENLGEAIEIKKNFALKLEIDETAGNTTDFDTITNVRLVNLETGTTFMGPEDPTAGDVGAAGAGNGVDTTDIPFSDEVVVETGEKLQLSIQADVSSDAHANDKYRFFADMSTLTIKGVESNKGNAEFSIKPSSNPSTKAYTISEPSLTFAAKALSDDTFVSDAEDVVIWSGTVRANNVEDLYIRRIGFVDNGGTATTSDVDDFSFWKKEGNTLTPIETRTDPSSSMDVVFSSLDENGGINGLLVPAGDEFDILLTANISSNPTAPHTIIQDLDVDSVSVEDENGDDATVTNGADIPSGATFTLADNGSLTVTLDNNKTSAAIWPAGSTGITAGVFQFDATDEPIEVADLTVDIVGVNTADPNDYSSAEAQADVANDANAVDKVSLFYYDDGTAVKNTNGSPVSRSVSSGVVYFDGLDLVIDDGDSTLIEVRADLRGMDDQASNQTARSGMAFQVQLDLDVANDAATIRGADSGQELAGANITVENDADLVTGDADDTTNTADAVYVFNNKVIATETASQPSASLSTGIKKELLKFTLDSTGDTSDEPFLTSVLVTIAGTGSACLSTSGVCAANDGVLYLYNGKNELIAVTDAIVGGTGAVTLTVGDPNTSGATLTTSLVDGAGTSCAGDGSEQCYDEILSTGETYTVKADMYTDGDADALSATIEVNASTPGVDDITWKDGGSTGLDGLNVQWIDLGETSSVTQITNTLKN